MSQITTPYGDFLVYTHFKCVFLSSSLKVLRIFNTRKVRVSFWDDPWSSSISLKERFHDLYLIDYNPDRLMSEVAVLEGDHLR